MGYMLTRPNIFFLLSKTEPAFTPTSINSAPLNLKKFLMFGHYSIHSNSTITDWYIKTFNATPGDGLASLYCAKSENINNEYWMFITPISLVPTNDDLFMHQSENITENESRKLFAVLQEHLIEEFDCLTFINPTLWGLKTKNCQDLLTVEYERAVNNSIADHIMTGSDSKKWRRLTSEIEILFSQHSVNLCRQKDGKHPINSIWIWGTGCPPNLDTSNTLISSERQLALNLAKVSQGIIMNPIETLKDIKASKTVKNIIFELKISLYDSHTWNIAFNKNWLLPASLMQQKGQLGMITLVFENKCQTVQIDLHKMSHWKIWRHIYPPYFT